MSKSIKDTEKMMQAIAGALDETLNGPNHIRSGNTQKNGFVVLVFPFGGEEGRRTNYISNCSRADVLSALEEVVERFRKQLG